MDLYKIPMAKIIVMVRTSTEAQSIEEQRKEMEDFCRSEGWTDIVWVEKQGASAAKVDDDYRAMIDEVKRRVEEDKDIKCFAVWHLNRLARTEEVWVEIKSFFVSHKVQIICKNPYLKLLTPSGDVDQGMELAMGLLAILSKQDQTERKAKFKRAKSAMMKRGQYVGGNIIKFGYRVEDTYYVIDEDDSKIVREIFDLYSTGQYSIYTLSKELSERGMPVTASLVQKTIGCRAYIGDEVGEYGLHYPPIISKELFEKCEKVRESNKTDMKRGERVVLGAKLVKCYKCGGTCTSNSRHYVCARHFHHGPCDNGFALRQCVADELLFKEASIFHLQYLIDMNNNKDEEYRKELELTQAKLSATKLKIDECQSKKDRIVENYEDGLISKEKRDTRLSKVEDDMRAHQGVIAALQDRIRAISRLLEKKEEVDDVEVFMAALDTMDAEDAYDIVHKHIVSLTAEPQSFGKRDPRTHRPNGVLITITSVTGYQAKYMYVPNGKVNLYVWNGTRWVGNHVTITDKKK